MVHISQIQPIAIIGGGPAGATLARILEIRGIDVAVYENEPHENFRPQGGTLDLHPESGQRAIEIAGLKDEFLKLCRPEGQDMKIVDSTGKVYLDHESGEDEPDFRPEIDRSDLRRILLHSLKPNTVKWDHKLKSITKQEDGKIKLVFENGFETVAGLVIGADGAWSRVRALLTDAKPVYSGITFIEFHLSQISKNHPELAKFVGRGTVMALGNNQGLIPQCNSGDNVRVYAALRVPFEWLSKFDTNPEVARARLLELFSDWDSSITDLIRYADATKPNSEESGFTTRHISALPTGTTWESQPNLTVIGDAAHVMSPFAGEGVNLAMEDALELALALTSESDVAAGIKAYESAMLKRVEFAARESASNLEIFFAPDAPLGFVAKMEEVMAHGPPIPN